MINLIEYDDNNNLNVVHIVNLNEDPLLSWKLIYNMEKMKILKIGWKKNDENWIILNGVNINKEHAEIEYDGDLL